ncbi:site-specific integrase [Erwinia psidii]|uniref:tyrosine-type recombinase/integrase n=1 Tax=Erwinia psidii TaxID=69224 RepID=UPI00226B9382|nr:site-specific integrase [Erwinia psidii]MCX8957058.1 site-specific integrase [Erwinia psidii]
MKGNNGDCSWQMLVDEYFFHKHLREQTELSYMKVVNVFRKFMGLLRCPESITQRDVLMWRRHVLKEQGSSSHTWNNKVAHMRALYNFWIKQKLVSYEENPFNGVSVKSHKKRKKTLSVNQMTRVSLVMQQFGEDEKVCPGGYANCALYPVWYWNVVLDTLRYTGMRQNQLLHIRLKDVCFDEGAIELRTEGSKTYREWKVPIVAHLRPQLRMLTEKAIACGAERDDILFHFERFVSTPDEREKLSGMPSLQPLRSFFRRLSNECGFFVTPHRFRHTLATTLMESPERNLQLVKGLLGHSSVSTTMEYIDINMDIAARTLEQELSLFTDKRTEGAYKG